MRASVMPGATLMPRRTASSVMTPPMGAVMVCNACGRPLRCTSSTTAAVMPSSSRRARAACASAASPVARTARYSCCAPSQSGFISSTSGAPAATTSPGARAGTRSTKPAVRACTMATSRSLSCTVPRASALAPMARCATVAKRTPSACSAAVETVSAGPAGIPACASSA